MTRYGLLACLLLVTLFLIGARPAAAAGTVFIVNDTNDLIDLNPGDGICGTRKGTCSLRAAIQEANAFCGGSYGCEETIELPAGTFLLTRTGADDTAAKGDLDITGSVTMRGAGAAQTIIDGNGSVVGDRIFHLIGNPLVNYFVNIEGVTLTNGINKRGGAIYNQGMVLTFATSQILYSTSTYWGGGAIYNQGGRLDLVGSNFAYNIAQGDFGFGGAIYNEDADLYVSQSSLIENSGDGGWGYGGAIYSISSGVIVDQSLISGNYSADYGGGIYVSNSWLNIIKSTIEDNYAATAGGGILVGTISTFKLAESTVKGNMADINVGEGGGGLFLQGKSAEITDSEISHNSARVGGGIYNGQDETIITRTTISHNYATPDGGGVYHWYGTLKLIQSTVSDNKATRGAGIFEQDYGYNHAPMFLVNTTVSSNMALIDGGGIFIDKGNVSLYNATVAANQADSDKDTRGAGGGIFNLNGTANLTNSLLADNIRPDNGSGGPDDCYGTVYSNGYNLIESPIACSITGNTTGNIIGQDPQLGVLKDNGGLTWTHAIPLGSPAVETADPNGCRDEQGLDLKDDQRGFGRHLDGDGDQVDRCDIGAYENGEAIWPWP